MERVFNITYIDMDGKEQTIAVVAKSPLEAFRQVPPNEKVLWLAELLEPGA